MSKKLKIVLGLLVLLAGFLLARIGLTIKKSAETASRIRGESTETAKENLFLKDSDSDGIPDYSEAYYRTDPFKSDTDDDGFLDGEEIASGCSPTVSGTDGCTVGRGSNRLPKNITEHFGNLMFGGILSNDLKKDNPTSSNHLGMLVDEALKTKRLLLTVDNTNLTIVPVGAPLSDQDYLNELESILKKYLFIEKNSGNLDSVDFENFDFLPYIQDLEQLGEKLSKVSPPKDWVNTHEKLLVFALKLRTYLSGLSEDQDPLKSLVALSNTESILNEYDEIIKEVASKIKNYGLTTNLFVL